MRPIDIYEMPAAKSLNFHLTIQSKQPFFDGSFEHQIRAAVGEQDIWYWTVRAVLWFP